MARISDRNLVGELMPRNPRPNPSPSESFCNGGGSAMMVGKLDDSIFPFELPPRSEAGGAIVLLLLKFVDRELDDEVIVPTVARGGGGSGTLV